MTLYYSLVGFLLSMRPDLLANNSAGLYATCGRDGALRPSHRAPPIQLEAQGKIAP